MLSCTAMFSKSSKMSAEMSHWPLTQANKDANNSAEKNAARSMSGSSSASSSAQGREVRKEEEGRAGERGINRHRSIQITDTAIKGGGGEKSATICSTVYSAKKMIWDKQRAVFYILSALSLHRLAIQPRSRFCFEKNLMTTTVFFTHDSCRKLYIG